MQRQADTPARCSAGLRYGHFTLMPVCQPENPGPAVELFQRALAKGVWCLGACKLLTSCIIWQRKRQEFASCAKLGACGTLTKEAVAS